MLGCAPLITHGLLQLIGRLLSGLLCHELLPSCGGVGAPLVGFVRRCLPIGHTPAVTSQPVRTMRRFTVLSAAPSASA